MRAQVQRGFGGPDVCAIERIPSPVPTTGEVVLAVRACGLNRLDLRQRIAPVVTGFSLPHVAGMDVAGVVIARGPELPADAGPALGDAVVVDPFSACGACSCCTAGVETHCLRLQQIGSSRPGGFAEQVAVPARACHSIPAGLTFAEAAAIPVAAMTAWQALVQAGPVAAGETVLVGGAGTDVALAVMQFARSAGATVVGVAADEAEAQLALTAGYHHCVHGAAADVATQLDELTGGRGVDLAVEPAGATSPLPTTSEARRVSCAAIPGNEVGAAGGRGPLPHHAGGRRAGFAAMLQTVAASDIRPVIDSVHPFAQLAAAQARLADATTFGKLVVAF